MLCIYSADLSENTRLLNLFNLNQRTRIDVVVSILFWFLQCNTFEREAT